MSHDLVDQLLEAAERHAGLPALTDIGGTTLTYRELAQQIRVVASRLRALGFGPGDRMLFSIRPCLPGIALFAGAVAAGGSVVFLDPGMGEELFLSRLSLVEPTWAAAESLLYAAGVPGPVRAFVRRKGLLLPKLGALPLRHIHSGPWLPGVPRVGSVARSELARSGRVLPRARIRTAKRSSCSPRAPRLRRKPWRTRAARWAPRSRR